jgi:hypothetical protein
MYKGSLHAWHWPFVFRWCSVSLNLKGTVACRWAVLNDVAILRRHASAHEELAQRMAADATVGECISVIEKHLAQSDDV